MHSYSRAGNLFFINSYIQMLFRPMKIQMTGCRIEARTLKLMICMDVLALSRWLTVALQVDEVPGQGGGRGGGAR